MAVFEASVDLACPLEAAFEFLAQPANLRLITPSSMMLVFDAAPMRLSLGARMEFRVQTHGVVRSAVHEVIAWDEPRHFVERQLEGPTGSWEHEHLFEPISNGTRVTDRIIFSPPGGVLGLLINERKMREALEDGFEHRHLELEKRFGTPMGAR
jgi:ligand-binding SRPBCC domain-containing protein